MSVTHRSIGVINESSFGSLNPLTGLHQLKTPLNSSSLNGSLKLLEPATTEKAGS